MDNQHPLICSILEPVLSGSKHKGSSTMGPKVWGKEFMPENDSSEATAGHTPTMTNTQAVSFSQLDMFVAEETEEEEADPGVQAT